jgi:hypothetical protein
MDIVRPETVLVYRFSQITVHSTYPNVQTETPTFPAMNCIVGWSAPAILSFCLSELSPESWSLAASGSVFNSLYPQPHIASFKE